MGLSAVNREASKCPECRRMTFYVTESRFTQGVKRRRRRCRACVYAATTYEISASDFKLLKKAKVVEQVFCKPDKSKSRPKLGPPTAVCDACMHWAGQSCDFGFPDAGGRFAEECSVYVHAV